LSRVAQAGHLVVWRSALKRITAAHTCSQPPSDRRNNKHQNHARAMHAHNATQAINLTTDSFKAVFAGELPSGEALSGLPGLTTLDIRGHHITGGGGDGGVLGGGGDGGDGGGGGGCVCCCATSPPGSVCWVRVGVASTPGSLCDKRGVV
jgi:hypothetical protein